MPLIPGCWPPGTLGAGVACTGGVNRLPPLGLMLFSVGEAGALFGGWGRRRGGRWSSWEPAAPGYRVATGGDHGAHGDECGAAEDGLGERSDGGNSRHTTPDAV